MTVLGSSDLDVFPLGLGGNTFGWTSDKDTSFTVLDAYVAGGGNFIDTADSYSAWVPGHAGGESEAIIGEWTAARGNRDSVIIATKVFSHPQFRGLSPQNVLAAADASLARLRTEYIDLYFAHRDDPDVPVAEAAGASQRPSSASGCCLTPRSPAASSPGSTGAPPTTPGRRGNGGPRGT
jgi:aryl-alcohol dehydrogenase-like predicted oxidoreductase